VPKDQDLVQKEDQPMRNARNALFLLAVVALLAPRAPAVWGQAPAPEPPASAPGAAGAPRSEGFGEKVLVREIEVIVELPESLREGRRKSLGPQDFQIQEDGVARQVVKASPVAASEAAPWRMVLYFDRVLANPDTVYFTANSLAQRADQLTALGGVDVVVADPQPRVVLASCHEPRVLEQALTDLAAQSERQRDGAAAAARAKGKGGPGSAGPALPAIRRQEDRLVSLIASHSGGGPRALVLVADGFDTSNSGGNATTATAAVAEEPARTLAAYGWVAIAAPMHRQELGVEHREMTDTERIRQSASGHDAPGSVTQPPEILPQAAPNTRLNYDGVLNLFVQPSSATLTSIASATAGTVVGYPAQLTAALTSLAKRWDLFYLAPDPEDGKPRPVEVRLLPTGTVLRAPVWRRSSTPEEIAAARLHGALEGGAEHGTLPVTAALAADNAHSLRIAVGAFSTADALPAGPFRISIAYAGPGAPTVAVQHKILASPDLGEKGWAETVAVDPPPGTVKVGVEVEDLTHQIWGTTVISLPSGTVPGNH
jgi:hypothetical protein